MTSKYLGLSILTKHSSNCVIQLSQFLFYQNEEDKLRRLTAECEQVRQTLQNKIAANPMAETYKTAQHSHSTKKVSVTSSYIAACDMFFVVSEVVEKLIYWVFDSKFCKANHSVNDRLRSSAIGEGWWDALEVLDLLFSAWAVLNSVIVLI